jgi:hypothetical protein
MAYLVMMAARLVELHAGLLAGGRGERLGRVTASLLRCKVTALDPATLTAQHVAVHALGRGPGLLGLLRRADRRPQPP